MAFIKYLDKENIPEKNRVPDSDNIIQIHGINSTVMRNHYDMYITLMRKRSPLSRIQREEIAVAVSAVNECHYWLTHHGAGLRLLLTKEGMEQEKQDLLLSALESDHTTADISTGDMAMLDYAIKLTKTPENMSEGDVKKLQREGFDDRSIHDICASTAYFAFVNRMADGLGVELEDRFSENLWPIFTTTRHPEQPH